MTWFRCGGGGSGIPAALKNRMNAVLNKKFGTAVDYPAEGWPDDVNLLGKLPEKTVSGSIAHITDGADEVPIKSWEVEIAPTLTGKSAIECTQSGKNFLPLAVDYPNYTNTKNSVTLTVLSDGKVKLNGTASANTDFTFYSASTPSAAHLYVRNGTYTFSNIGNSNVKMVVSGGNNNGFPYREIANGSYTGTVTDETKPFNYIIFRISSGTQLDNVVVEPMLEYGSSASSFEPYTAPTQYTASLGRTIYGGTADVVNGTGTDENGNAFTFTPITPTPETALGVNNFWADEGDSEVTYRASGTVTPIAPTLITKTITANGTYQAADDQADGYSEVVVNVSTAVSADPIMSLNAFVSKSGVSGTNTSTVARSFTMSAAGTLVFASGSYGFTNIGSNEGYFEIQKNGVSVVKQYCNTSTNTPITIPEIPVEENDVVDLVIGFDNAHSNCSFQFYSAMVVLSEV